MNPKFDPILGKLREDDALSTTAIANRLGWYSADPLVPAQYVRVTPTMLIADSAWVFPTAAALAPTLTHNGNTQLADYAGNVWHYLTVDNGSGATNTDVYLPATWPVGVPLIAYLNSTGAAKDTIRVFGSSTETTGLASSASTLVVAFNRLATGWMACGGISRIVAGGLAGTSYGGISGIISGGSGGSVAGGMLATISGGTASTSCGGAGHTISGGTVGSSFGGGYCTISAGNTPSNFGGFYNSITSAAATYSATIAGAYNTVSSGSYNSSSGAYGNARTSYEACLGFGQFTSGAYNQERKWGYGLTTAATDATDMLYFTAGTAIQGVIPAEATIAAEILLQGRQDNGKSGMMRVLAQIERTANATRIVGSVVTMTAWQGDAELGTPTLAVTADDTNDCLKLTITPANNTSTRWGAKVILHEIIY